MFWPPQFKLRCLLALAGVTLAFSAVASAEEKLVVLPGSFELNGSSPRQTLLAESEEGGFFTGDLTKKTAFFSDNPAVVKIEGGVAVAVADGEATITATEGARKASARVKVSGLAQAQLSFRNHVQPILAKTGCSMGACHGAAAGQGGFRLSLRGYDDEGDFLALTRGAMGRRVTPADPARSLLLLKATNAVPHKGGERFKTHSPEWSTLVNWIAEGLPAPSAKDRRLERLEVMPALVRLAPGQKQQMLVRARFSDGHTEDVTRHAKFTAVNQSVINVDENGLVSVIGHGESAVSVWYLQQIAVGTVTAPFANQVPADVFTQAPRRNWIDELSLAKLQSLQLPPSPRCTDAEFIRRAFLDTIGILPTADEARAFAEDAAPDKRDRLIEQLLNRPEFVDYWSYKWSDLLLVTKRKVQPAAMWAYYQWIRNAVASNLPWDQFARELLTAQGSSVENGAANFFVIHPDPRDAAETTSQTFLGFSMNCAKCHNHPMEKWTNNDYYGFANLFSRVRMKNGEQAGENIVFASDEGDLVQPLTGKPQRPRPLDGQALKESFDGDRRTALVEWLTSPKNEGFKRTVVNRVWANFFGVGLVESVDDIRASNPASNEQLFARAAEFLVEQKFNLRALMRGILQSETYQRSSVPVPGNEGDSRFYSRYFPRRLMAEVLHDAIAQVTRVPTEFKTKDTSSPGDKAVTFPKGWRALQLPDVNTDSYFTRAFGRPLRDQTCECERTAEPSVTQALHVSNGDTINSKLQDKTSCVAQAVSGGLEDGKAIDEAYLSTVARQPAPAEKERLLKLFGSVSTEEKRTLLEDTYWALLSSKEFLFNH